MYNLRGVDQGSFLGKLKGQTWLWWVLPIGGSLVGEYVATGTVRVLTPHRRWRTERKALIGATVGGILGVVAAIGVIGAAAAADAGGIILPGADAPPSGSDIPPEFYEPGPAQEESF